MWHVACDLFGPAPELLELDANLPTIWSINDVSRGKRSGSGSGIGIYIHWSVASAPHPQEVSFILTVWALSLLPAHFPH